MEKLKRTAKVLSVVLKIADVVLTVGMIASLVGVALVGLGLFTDIPLDMIMSEGNSFTVEPFTFTFAKSEIAMTNGILLAIGGILLTVSGACFVGRMWMRTMRSITLPMAEGAPFSDGMSDKLRKLALYTVILGVVQNVGRFLIYILFSGVVGVPDMLTGGNVIGVSMNYDFDLGFLIVAAVVLLVSYVFRYGAELQKQSDETL